VERIVKVYPNDYHRVIEAQEEVRQTGLPEEQILMAAFQKNISDRLRAAGT
jgi:hypothetical protein